LYRIISTHDFAMADSLSLSLSLLSHKHKHTHIYIHNHTHITTPIQCIREVELKSLHGRKIAIDASMAIYQFLIAVRTGGAGNAATMLTNADGETTSHIQGMFNRTIRFLSEGLKPVFVFDGKPPQFKSGELQKRREKREKAQVSLVKAQEEGNVEEQDKHSKRLVRAGTKENQECQKLLQLMGVPVVLAPCEAEAQAASLAKAGLVYATGTEDMDALTFATPVLVRKMTFANNSKSMVQTISYAKAVEGLGLTHAQFVDLCILLGCDYTDSIKGVGPKTALKLIREHGSIEKILETIDRKKYGIPDGWEPNKKKEKQGDAQEEDAQSDKEEQEEEEEEKARLKKGDDDEEEDKQEILPEYVQARKLFNNHEVLDEREVELKWKPPQVEELTKYLVDQMGFSADRVKSNIAKLETAFKANQKPQARMDSFFKAVPNAPLSDAQANKRKAKQQAEKKDNKKKAKPAVRKRR
jgi:flap endonuclease-1